MRTLNVFRATMLFGLIAGAVFASTDGQTPPRKLPLRLLKRADDERRGRRSCRRRP